MAGGIDIKVLGDKELTRKLKRLEIKAGRKVVRTAIRETMKEIVLPAAKAKVPVDKGLLRKGLKVKAAKAKRGSFGSHVVTPTREKLNIDPSERGYYPAVLEYGASGRQIPARPFLRPAMDNNKTKVLRQLGRDIGRGILKLAKRKA